MSGQLEKWLVRRLLESVGGPPVAIELCSGERIHVLPEGSQPIAVAKLKDRRALFELMHKPEKSFGELFTDGRLSVQGDLVATLESIDVAMQRAMRESGPVARLMRRTLERRPRANTLAGSKENIHSHYDLGNDFYRLWLDQDYMQYTCAYYPGESTTLEEAQVAKLELVCRKLDLKPGDQVVEAGSGWGGLARYIARHYGATVHSYNISSEQVAYARERAEAEGLGNLVEYVEDDYRNISGTYDAFVSVGMLEHVGLANYQTLGEVMNRCLKDEGRGFVHSIGRNVSRPMNEWIESYIFPGAYPPTLKEMMEIFEPFEFVIMDVENLRSHYARTLTHWLERFERNVERVREMFDENFVHAWRLYLSGSISAFTQGQLQLFQVLFQRQGANALPVTRERMLVRPDVAIAGR
ncbi:MAG: cyclopropane-fatty-acyl-phospholipid synthase family protein [Pseudomonadales bacterium]|jgi:cyclopropane-fatty-acyl-phospholipid synthase